VDQQLALGKVMYNLEVQEKISAHRLTIEAMSSDLVEMLGVVKTLLCLDARDHHSVLSSSLDASGVRDGEEGDLKSPTTRRGSGGRFVGKAAAVDAKPAPKHAGEAPDASKSGDGPSSQAGTAKGDTKAATPKAEGQEPTRDLDLSVIHQKLLQGCYKAGRDVQADINKVLQTAIDKETAQVGKGGGKGKGDAKATPPKPEAQESSRDLREAEAAAGGGMGADGAEDGGAVASSSKDRVKLSAVAAAAAAARAFQQHMPDLLRAEHENTLAVAAGTGSSVGSRMVSISAHLDGIALAPAAASTRAGMQLERGWLGSTLRTRPLGRDRLNRQYWWFDWPQGWLAVEACPAKYRNIAGEKLQAPVPSSKSKPSRSKPPAGDAAAKRPLSGAAATSAAVAAAAAAAAAAGLPSSKAKKRPVPDSGVASPSAGDASGANKKAVWDWKTNQAIDVVGDSQDASEELQASVEAAMSPSSQSLAARLPEEREGGDDADAEMEGDPDGDGDCKACQGMHRAHTCAKRGDTTRLGTVAKPGTAVVKRKVAPPLPPLPVVSASKEVASAGGSSSRARAKPKFKVPTIKELSSYQIGCHLDSEESPFRESLQCLCSIDHWVVYKTPQEVDGVGRTLDVRSPLDAKLLRRLKAERCRLQPPAMAAPAAASSPLNRERNTFCTGFHFALPVLCSCKLLRRRVSARRVFLVPLPARLGIG